MIVVPDQADSGNLGLLALLEGLAFVAAQAAVDKEILTVFVVDYVALACAKNNVVAIRQGEGLIGPAFERYGMTTVRMAQQS